MDKNQIDNTILKLVRQHAMVNIHCHELEVN
jgi:hypothetical protein